MAELDEIVKAEGAELDTSSVKIQNTEETVEKIDKFVNNLAYDDAAILPSSKVAINTSEEASMEKDDAELNMVVKLAEMKLQKEREEFQRLSDDEKIKQYIFESYYRQNVNSFYRKNGYDMTGKQKRNLKRNIERSWATGKIKLSEEERQDILFEINKATNNQKSATASEIAGNTKQAVTNANGLISVL